MSALSRFGGSREPHFDVKVQSEEGFAKSTKHGSISSPTGSPDAQVRSREPSRTSPSRPAQARDFKIAIQMLERATTGVDDISDKIRRVEQERDNLLEKIERYKELEIQWLADMNSAKSRFTKMEAEMSSLSEKLIIETTRSATLEAKLAETEEKLRIAEEENKELEADCIALHDSILESFGVGSQAYQTFASVG